LKKINKWQKLFYGLLSLLKKSVRVFIQKTLQDVKTPLKKRIEVKGVNLLLIRKRFNKICTIGELFLNGEKFCDTLELPWKNNEKSVSCIPHGVYKARLRLPRESATRNYIHILVKDVPDRSYILFHRGNTAKDSRGCVLVGFINKQNSLKNSTLAMDLLIKEIINLGDGYNINLIIKNQ